MSPADRTFTSPKGAGTIEQLIVSNEQAEQTDQCISRRNKTQNQMQMIRKSQSNAINVSDVAITHQSAHKQQETRNPIKNELH